MSGKRKREIDFKLHEHGFMILKNVFESNDALVAELTRQGRAKDAGIIFNYEKNDDEDAGDFKRQQRPLDFSKRVVAKMNDAIVGILKRLFKHHTITESVVLYSYPGCRRQPVHTDYTADENICLCSDELFPMGALVAVEKHSKLYVWTNSIRLQRLNPEFLRTYNSIEPHVVEMHPGEVVVFRGDLFHCGADYNQGNVRIHYFVDSAKVPRLPNQTWILRARQEKKESELARIIKE